MEFTTDTVTENCFYLSMAVTFSSEYYSIVFHRMVEFETNNYGTMRDVNLQYKKETDTYEWVMSNNWSKMHAFGMFFDGIPHKIEIFYGGDMYCM